MKEIELIPKSIKRSTHDVRWKRIILTSILIVDMIISCTLLLAIVVISLSDVGFNFKLLGVVMGIFLTTLMVIYKTWIYDQIMDW